MGKKTIIGEATISEEKIPCFFSIQGYDISLIAKDNENLNNSNLWMSRFGVKQLKDILDVNESKEWITGVTEDNKGVYFYKGGIKRIPLFSGFISSIRIMSPCIIYDNRDYFYKEQKFDSITFYGKNINIVYPVSLIFTYDFKENPFGFREYSEYTREFNLNIEEERVTLKISIESKIKFSVGKLPDLNNDIFSIIKLKFEEKKTFDSIQKYYVYILNLLSFINGQRNIDFNIKLGKKDSKRNKEYDAAIVDIYSGFEDYIDNEHLLYRKIRLDSLFSHLKELIELLNDENKAPNLLFIPQRNSEVNKISYYRISSICTSLEREFKFQNRSKRKQRNEEANELAKKLNEIVKNESCSDELKEKAYNVVNGIIKNFSLSLLEKIMIIYDIFYDDFSEIAEQKRINWFPLEREVAKNKVKKFIEIRNRSQHDLPDLSNIDIFMYKFLIILIYLSVLERTGFSSEERIEIFLNNFRFGFL